MAMDDRKSSYNTMYVICKVYSFVFLTKMIEDFALPYISDQHRFGIVLRHYFHPASKQSEDES